MITFKIPSIPFLSLRTISKQNLPRFNSHRVQSSNIPTTLSFPQFPKMLCILWTLSLCRPLSQESSSSSSGPIGDLSSSSKSSPASKSEQRSSYHAAINTATSHHGVITLCCNNVFLVCLLPLDFEHHKTQVLCLAHQWVPSTSHHAWNTEPIQ